VWERLGGRRRRGEDIQQRGEFGVVVVTRTGGEAAAEEEGRCACLHLTEVVVRSVGDNGEWGIRVCCLGWCGTGACLCRERPKRPKQTQQCVGRFR
jgi:hypothetical protein